MKLNKITPIDAQRIKKSDREFSALLRQNSNFLRKLVWGYIKKNSLNNSDSEIFEDAYQEACLSLWSKALDKYNGSTKFSTFAYKVIKNDILAFLQKRSSFTSKRGDFISIEKLKTNKESQSGSEYFENSWKVDLKKRCFEDSLIEKMDEENLKNNFSSIDLKIYELKSRGWSGKNIAQALGMNFHTYKSHLYGSYIPKMKKIGVEINEE